MGLGRKAKTSRSGLYRLEFIPKNGVIALFFEGFF